MTVEAADVPVGHARVRARTDAGEVDLVVAPTTMSDSGAQTELTAKWTHVLGPAAGDLVPLAREALTPSGRPGRLAQRPSR